MDPIVLDCWAPISTGTTANTSLNAAGTWLAYSFLAEGKTLSSVRVYIQSPVGSPAAADLICHLQASASGAPSGTTIESRAAEGTTLITGTADFTGFSTALTAGQRYWLVFKNTSASPTTVYPVIRSVALMPLIMYDPGSATGYGWRRRVTTDSGGSWGAGNYASFRIGYSDGTFEGVIGWAINTTDGNTGVYGTREVGNWFMTPDNVKLNVSGIMVQSATKTNSPTGKLRFRLYSATDYPNTAPTLLKTAELGPVGINPSINYIYSMFDTPQLLLPGQPYLATVGETTQSDTSTNRYNFRITDYDAPDTNSLGMLPHGIAMVYYDGTSWGAKSGSGRALSIALMLNKDNEFLAP